MHPKPARNLYRLAILAHCLLAGLGCPALGASQDPVPILADPRHQATRFSVHFVDLESGRTLFEHNADVALAPASNMKLITTAAAVDQLGIDFGYETIIGLLGDDLVVLGGGDPLTGDPVLAEQQGRGLDFIFQQVLEQLQKRSRQSIPGDLLVDSFLFDDERFCPSWPADQANNWYTAQVAALNYNDNCLDIALDPADRVGEPARVRLTPSTRYVSLDNQSRTASGQDASAWAARQADTNRIIIRGSVVKSIDLMPLTIDRPSAFFGHVLAEHLLAGRVPIHGKLIVRQVRDSLGRVPGDLDILYTHQTALRDVLVRANRDSLNLAAECLFKTLGAYYNPPAGAIFRQGSWQTGRLAVTAFLEKLNVAPYHYQIVDGSGLSRENRLSARCITTVLTYIYRHPAAGAYRATMASPTSRGTLSKNRRFREAAYRDRLQVKTGYVRGTWALSGFCQTRSGRWLAFSILANNQTDRSAIPLIDQLVKAMID